MLSLLIVIVTTALETSVFARNTCQDLFVSARSETTSARRLESLRLSVGTGNSLRSLALEHLPAQPGQPTLLMMPGAISPVSAGHPAFKKLAQSGVGLVSFAYSHQPGSLKAATREAVQALEQGEVSISGWVAETLTVRDHFARQGVELIPVSLSFTGAVTPSLQGFNRIIEMVPMTSTDATSATGAAVRDQLKAAAMWNPFFGQQLVRQQIDFSYRAYWQSVVDSLARDPQFPGELRGTLLDQYVRQSQAIEGFKWDVASLPRSIQRTFVLAGQESQSLLKHQLQTVVAMIEAGHQPNVVLVKGVGHNIPSSQPDTYAQLLAWAARDSRLDGLYIFDSATARVESIPRAAMLARLRAWEASLSSVDREASLP